MQASAKPGQGIEILAPTRGWLWPLERVPDPAFAEGALGPGLALDPLDGVIRSPIAGEVVTLNASRHAVVIRHASGAEVLVHIGIDTVALGGAGFTAHAAEGDRVGAGDILIEADFDAVAASGRSLVTPVVVVSPADARIEQCAASGLVEAGTVLFRLADGAALAVSESAGESASGGAKVALAHGVHARPAAAIVRILREGGLSGQLSAGERQADLASVVALMRAGIAAGDSVTLEVSGPGAGAALGRIKALLEGDFAEAEAVPAAPPAPRAAPAGMLAGQSGSPGLALGAAFHHRAARFSFAEQGAGAEAEMARLDTALAAVAAELAHQGHGGALGEVLGAHRELLDDPELARLARAGIAEGQSAPFAWQQACRAAGEAFAVAGERMAGRAADLEDLSRRVLAQLCGGAAEPDPAPSGALVLASDLLPSELAAYARQGIAGAALAGSSPAAHVAIIAAGLGLPLVTGLGTGLTGIAAGQMLILDGAAGLLDPAPNVAAQAQARAAIAAAQGQAEADRAAAHRPAQTRDGAAIAVHANLGGTAQEARDAAAQGADGCGLLRSEFLFQDRTEPPGENEQAAAYGAVLQALGGRGLTLRTLDIGGDKPVPFLPAAQEENPALGLRGIRLGLARRDLLMPQLRAALRAGADAAQPLELMVPMISGLDEWREVRRLVSEAQESLGSAAGAVRLGLMIETPAAVLLADRLATEADFFSIGTNDLTQYVLAMDRTNPALAAAADPLHPAVLSAIAFVCQQAASRDCPVSVCGALGGDPLAIPLLIGLGVSKLSVVPGAVAAAKRAVRTTDRAAWAVHARKALNLASAGEVREFCRQTISAEEQA